jgi:hypothetical protein
MKGRDFNGFKNGGKEELSVFLRAVNEICALLGFYAE